MKVLIVTHTTDNECVDMVTQALEHRGARAFRLDTDLFPTETKVEIRIAGGEQQSVLKIGGVALDASELTAAWHRRLSIAAAIPASMEAQTRTAAMEESRRVIHGLLASLSCFVLDPWPRIRIAEQKQLQLEVARVCGLDIPRTLVTNDPAAAREFYAACHGRVVAKMMASFAIYAEGLEQVVFTNPLTEKDLDALGGLRFSPMTFQEKLEKEVELRVTVVGERVFAAAIDSNQFERSKTDWRREGQALVGKWKPYDLPRDVERGLLRLMDAFAINYGAIDLIVTPDGRCVFLEVNPAGEFFWLESENGFPISEAIADALLGLAPRREASLLVNDPRASRATSPRR